jgi:hypothetical protein
MTVKSGFLLVMEQPQIILIDPVQIAEIIGVRCGWAVSALIGFFLNGQVVHRITPRSS